MNRRTKVSTCFLGVLGLVLCGGSLGAQEASGLDAETPIAVQARSFATSDPAVPAGAVRSFIDACRGGRYQEAARYLSLDSVDAKNRDILGPRYARQLKIVLDRTLWIQYELLSDRPEGDLEDGLPDNLERLGTIGEFEALLERMPDDNGRQVWRIATGTVDSIPSLYARHGLGRLGELLPAPLLDISFLELRLWQWIGLVLLLGAALVCAWLLGLLAHRIGRSIAGRTETTLDDQLLDRLHGPVRFLLAIALFAMGSVPLALSVPTYRFLNRLEIVALVLAITWGVVRGVDVAVQRTIDRLNEEGRKALISVVLLTGRVMKAILLALALIVLLQNVGLDVTGLIAGLGVGGLAIALAAQKTIANLFGGVSLVADQPVRVGDFCKFGDNKTGTVEEIGIRSTRVRTLDRTLVTIPNSEFSEMQLENYGARDQVRLLTTLTLRYETSPDQLRHVLTELRKMLVAHPRVAEDPARVRFVNFGAFSLDLEIVAYITTHDWAEFLKVREDIFLRIMDIVNASGTGFAYPSQTLYLGRDGGLDAMASRDAESSVQAWREAGELPFPDLDEQTVEELDGSLDYPPRGSVSHR